MSSRPTRTRIPPNQAPDPLAEDLPVIQDTSGAGGRGLASSVPTEVTRRLASLLASVPVGMLEEDVDGRILLVNQSFCRMFGLEERPDAFVGRTTCETLSGLQDQIADPEVFLARMAELSGSRERILGEELRLLDGRTFECDVLPGDPADLQASHFWVFRDATAERTMTAELRRTAEHYRDFVENGIASAFSHDLDGVLVSANRALARVLGASSPEELVGRRIQEAMDPKYRQLWDAYLQEILEAGEARGIGTFRGVDGRRLVLAYRNVMRHDDEGRPVVRGFGGDVTERVRAEQELRRRSELENQLVAISTRLINLSAASIEEAIDQALQDLAQNLRVDRGIVYTLSPGGETLDLAHRWSGDGMEGFPAPPERITVAHVPALMKTLHRLEPYRVARLDDLPPSSFLERRTLEGLGVQSVLVVPISTRGELMGFAGLSMHREERWWPEEVVSVVRVIGDIIGGAMDRKRTEEALAAANRALATANRVLEENQQAMSLLNEMGDLVLTAQGLDEVRELARSFVPRIFAGVSGAVYFYAEPEHDRLDPIVGWGAAAPADGPVRIEECWALRRSRPHQVGDETSGPFCAHAADARDHHSLCIPLMANGQLLGLLHLRQPRLRTAGLPGDLDEAKQVAYNTAEQLALGLANLQLRESLRSQALHDPLTGLHNRRYLEERLASELRRAERAQTPVSILMLDLDHFKRVNDVYGHAAGDRVLAQVARFLEAGVRSEDVVARYGGEEFTVLLAGTTEEDARWVAEKLRKGVRRVAAAIDGAGPETLSLSIGLAAWPACGGSADDLLAVADAALYEAKRGGRDRIVVAAPALASQRHGGR
jgi:diguanylate cyclase (GGDEF)-like protein/PAS domain S-box-containing protein